MWLISTIDSVGVLLSTEVDVVDGDYVRVHLAIDCCAIGVALMATVSAVSGSRRQPPGTWPRS